MPVTTRIAGKTDLRELVDTLSDAFAEDPVMLWMFGDAKNCLRGAPGFFRTTLRSHYLRLGTTDIADGGAAVWAPPGRHDPGTLRQLGQVPWLIGAFRAGLGRAASAGQVMNEHHPPEPHWYLQFVGVRQSHTGKGIGSALLGARLAEADAAGMPAYLESSNERNLTLYERHGFAVTGELSLGKGAPPLYAMWRKAVSEPA